MLMKLTPSTPNFYLSCITKKGVSIFTKKIAAHTMLLKLTPEFHSLPSGFPNIEDFPYIRKMHFVDIY